MINRTLGIMVYLAVVLLLGNLNAIVDAVLHPDIPYFDEEHLIVGGVAVLVSSILFGLLAIYVRHLEDAARRIRKLEAILPMCANCKSVRKPDADSKDPESWQTLESFVAETMRSEFTNSICPKCAAKLYSNHSGSNGIENSKMR